MIGVVLLALLSGGPIGACADRAACRFKVGDKHFGEVGAAHSRRADPVLDSFRDNRLPADLSCNQKCLEALTRGVHSSSYSSGPAADNDKVMHM